MNEKISKFLIFIFGTGIYFWGATILFQYGYNSYFFIPSNFIEVSIRENIIYFFNLSQIAGGILSSFNFWKYFSLIILLLSLWIFYIISNFTKKIFLILVFILSVFLLYGSYNFGIFWAETRIEYYVIPNECLSLDNDMKYIIPTFFETKAIVIPIDENNRNINNSILIKEIADINCEIKKENTGVVVK